MDILMTILYILLFIIFLSVLIVIHELGHLATAKAFKVYCLEFSIGMGPALFKKKRKNGETQFSIRAIPFGGYVSMFEGNPAALPEGLNVDPSRSLSGIKKWKKAIIMVAGVFMNAVLAFSIFFIDAWVPQQFFYFSSIKVNSTTLSIPANDYNINLVQDWSTNTVATFDIKGEVHFKDGKVISDVVVAADYSNISFKNTALSEYVNFYYQMFYTAEDGQKYPYISTEYLVDISEIDYANFNFNIRANETESLDVPITVRPKFDETKQTYLFEDFGVSLCTDYEKARNIGEAFEFAGQSFVDGSTIIVQSLGSIFTKPSEVIQNSGGIIAVGFETTNTLQNLGWFYFLYLWGVISINLAIINLLPFPGLDGWHLLVLIIEGITHKTIPEKVKNIISFIGLGLLMILMVMFLFKDTFKYIFSFVVGSLLL